MGDPRELSDPEVADLIGVGRRMESARARTPVRAPVRRSNGMRRVVHVRKGSRSKPGRATLACGHTRSVDMVFGSPALRVGSLVVCARCGKEERC